MSTERIDAILSDLRNRAPRPDTEPVPSAIGEDVDRAAMHRTRLEAEWSRVVPPVYGDPTLARFADGDGGRYPAAPPEVVDALTRWAEAPNRNLVIIGPVGTGKTFAAWAALRRAFGHGHDVAAYGAVDLLDALRPGGDPDAADEARDAEILFVDDLGAHRGTEWVDERLYSLIHHRWEQQRPTVVTANVAGGDDLRDALGERTHSRLTGGAVAVALYGEDRRKS